jgi:transposase
MKLYAGIDLHANNNYLAIIDENDTRVYKRKLPNQPDVILAELEPFKANISGIVVESTFNWYWLVDLLMDAGYCLHLANPAAIQKYKGLKHSDDNHDAFWLAHMLRLKILPEGYIPQRGPADTRFVTETRPSGATSYRIDQQPARDYQS